MSYSILVFLQRQETSYNLVLGLFNSKKFLTENNKKRTIGVELEQVALTFPFDSTKKEAILAKASCQNSLKLVKYLYKKTSYPLEDGSFFIGDFNTQDKEVMLKMIKEVYNLINKELSVNTDKELVKA